MYETGGTKIKSFDFNYSYFQSSSLPDFSDNDGTDYTYYKSAVAKRLKLESITEAGVNPYVFSYNSTQLPHRASTQQDFWGFYTPNSSNSLIPITYEYPDETVTATSFHTSSFSIYPRSTYTGTQIIHNSSAWDRSSDTTAIKAGVLTEIIYPTKGGTLFTYSPGEFYVNGQRIYGAGLRIRQMRISKTATYTTSDDIIKNFDYHNSGQVVDLPVYGAYGSRGAGGVMFFGNWSGGLALTKGSYVGYGQITESIAGNGKTIFKYKSPAMYGVSSDGLFTRPLTEKKYLTYQPRYGSFGSCIPWLTGAQKLDFFPRPFAPNYDWERGLLDESEIWDEQGNLIKRVKNNYTIKSYKKINNIQVSVVHVDQYASSALGINYCFAGRHCYNFARTYDISPWIILDKTTEYLFNGGSTPIVQTKNFYYTSTGHKQMTQNRVTQSDASILETTMKYPFEYQSVPGKAPFIQKMLDQHILDTPIETYTYIEKSPTDRKVIDATLTTFKTYPGPSSKPDLILPYKVFKFNGYNGSIGTSFVFYTGTSEETATSSYREVLTYTDYDSKGNTLSLLSNKTHKLSYLWAYNGQFPVAQIKNANYSEVSAALTAASSSYSALSAMTNPNDIKSKTDAVRTSLASSQVTGYQYFWLTGLYSVTDPTDKTLYYERDIYGRVKTIHSGGGLIRVSYCYNYAGMTTDCQSISASGFVTPTTLSLIPEQEGALPVILIDFDARKEGAIAELTWGTTSETNSKSFEIQHSIDGKKWSILGTVSAKGESITTSKYDYKHVSPSIGENLYRLKMIDQNGTHTFSRICSLVFGDGLDIIFYPNPVTVGERLRLQANDPKQIGHISIYDNSGKMVMQTDYKSEINVSELPSGLYIVQVVGNDGTVAKHKIVKQ